MRRTSYLQYLSRIIIILSIFSCLIPKTNVVAADDCPEEMIDWIENLSRSFAIIYPKGNGKIGATISRLYKIQLDKDYAQFTTLFKVPLTVPIIIRVYPDSSTFYCFNPMAPHLPASTFSITLGTREIALIEDKVRPDQARMELVYNAIRHDLVILFTEQLSGGKAPPGLLSGLGTYAEDPTISLGMRDISGSSVQKPTSTWRSLWESPGIQQDRGGSIQAMSIIAYLIDTYKWEKFQTFLSSLSTEESYRAALTSTYGINFSDLEAQWKNYYPYFYSGRWKANIFHEFDLSEFEQLMNAGAYSDAAEGLKEAIVFLESIGDEEKIQQAEELMRRSQLGQEAAALIQQSRQALQQKDYERSISLANQSEQIYLELEDQRRIPEISTYKTWSQEVLDLRGNIRQFQSPSELVINDEAISELTSIGTRLTELGDVMGEEEVEKKLKEIEELRRRRSLFIINLGAFFCIVFLGVRIALLRRSPPPEASLL
jgi:hypothetical protein